MKIRGLLSLHKIVINQLLVDMSYVGYKCLKTDIYD